MNVLGDNSIAFDEYDCGLYHSNSNAARILGSGPRAEAEGRGTPPNNNRPTTLHWSNHADVLGVYCGLSTSDSNVGGLWGLPARRG